jgi:predicted ATPase
MPRIKKLRIRNLLTYEDSGWIELGRRTLIVGPNGSGKTNIIRALRLLRTAIGLEGSIQVAELYSYLHDLGKSSAGIDLEISLSEGEAVDTCKLFCSYYDESQKKWISPEPSCEELKGLLTDDVRISFSWISANGESPLGSSNVKAFYAIRFSKANFGIFLRAEPLQMTDVVKHLSEYIYCSKPEDDLKKLYKKYDEVNKNCIGQKPFETRRKICEGAVCGSSEPECAVLQSVPIFISPFKEIAERAGITDYDDFYPAGYILLRAVLNNIIFAGSERTLSDVSKLVALRNFIEDVTLRFLIEKEPSNLADIIDSTLGWAREEQLDAYLRNVEPFLAHLSHSNDLGERQRFQKISECFSNYFDNVHVEVALEQFEARLQPRPALLRSKTQSTLVERLMSELVASLQNGTVKLQYHRIYLREKVGKSEVPIPIDMAGQGHRELLSLLTALIGRPGSVVFLDEPASNMHPTLLSRFLMDLMGQGECSKELGRNQVIVITHSPVVAKIFIEADASASEKNPAEEGLSDISDLSIISVHRVGDGASVIRYLTPDKWQGDKEEFLKTIGRIVDPRILFARGVVLCEGPADHAFLREMLRRSEKWNELLSNDVELVWMNSKNNLVKYDEVLNKLEIPYVAFLDFDALCEVFNRDDHPLYKACNNKKVLILTPNKLNELNNSGKLSGYRYVLLLDNDSVLEQLDCNDDNVLKSVCNKCIDKDNNCEKESKKSEKCELEGFLKGLGIDLLGCTDDGKLKPESVPECVEHQKEEVKGKIKQMGDILSKLISANILGGSTNATVSY